MKYLTWLVLATSVFFSYFFINRFMGTFSFLVFFFKILADIGIFSSVKYSEFEFKDSYMWYKDYEGSYKKIYTAFMELQSVFKKLNLDQTKYFTFGIYHDDPKKCDPDKCKAIVGIMRYDNNSNKTTDELISDLNMFKNEKKVKSFKTLISRLPCFNFFSIFIAIQKYYPRLETKMSELTNKYDLSGIPGIMELYSPDYIDFHIPLENYEELPTHSNFSKKTN